MQIRFITLAALGTFTLLAQSARAESEFKILRDEEKQLSREIDDLKERKTGFEKQRDTWKKKLSTTSPLCHSACSPVTQECSTPDGCPVSEVVSPCKDYFLGLPEAARFFLNDRDKEKQQWSQFDSYLRSQGGACVFLNKKMSDLRSSEGDACADAMKTCPKINAQLEVDKAQSEIDTVQAQIDSKSKERKELAHKIVDARRDCPECAMAEAMKPREPGTWDYVIGGIQALTPALLGWQQASMFRRGINAYSNNYNNYLQQCLQIGVPCPGPAFGGYGGFGGGGFGAIGGMGGFGAIGGMGGFGAIGGMGGFGGIGLIGSAIGSAFGGAFGFPGAFGGYSIGFPGTIGGGFGAIGFPGQIGGFGAIGGGFGAIGFPGQMGGFGAIGGLGAIGSIGFPAMGFPGGGIGFPGAFGGAFGGGIGGAIGGGIGFPGAIGGGIGFPGAIGGLGAIGGGIGAGIGFPGGVGFPGGGIGFPGQIGGFGQIGGLGQIGQIGFPGGGMFAYGQFGADSMNSYVLQYQRAQQMQQNQIIAQQQMMEAQYRYQQVLSGFYGSGAFGGFSMGGFSMGGLGGRTF